MMELHVSEWNASSALQNSKDTASELHNHVQLTSFIEVRSEDLELTVNGLWLVVQTRAAPFLGSERTLTFSCIST